MGGLAGRVAFVTGGSRGIGRAIALGLGALGADLAITYRREADAAAEVVGELSRLGRRGLALALDLTEPAGVAPAVVRAGQELGRLDVLVANAAATAFKPMLAQGPRNVRLTFALSVESFVEAVRAAVPLMTPGFGRIIVISGIDSHQAMAGHGVLGAAKAALESLVRTLALELGPRGITVNGVSPGFVPTRSSLTYVEHGLGLDPAVMGERLAAMTPVRRLGTPEDVAGLVGYLAGEEAGFLTGQTILLDGGLTIVSPLERLLGG